MSAVKLKPASGGGSVSLAPPNSTSGADVTITMPTASQGLGKILQVKTGTSLSGTSTTSTSSVEITSDLRISITPTSASNKIIVFANLYLFSSGNTAGIRLQRKDAGGSWGMVNTPSSGISTIHNGNSNLYANNDPLMHLPVIVIETAGSTTAREYSPFWGTTNGTIYFNRWSGDGYYATSNIIVMEVAA